MPENSVKIILEAYDKASAAFKQLESNAKSSFQGIQSSLSLIKWDALVNLGEKAIHATEEIYNFGKGIASSVNEIQRQSGILGISTDAFQKMSFAANMSDVTTADLAQGLKLLSRNMEDASKGTGEAKDYFDALGIMVQDTQGRLKPFAEIMGDIAAKFASWEDGPRKIAISLQLFGRSGEQLIPLLNQGRSGIEGFWQEAEKLGIVLDDSIIKKGTEAEDAFKRINAQILAMKSNLIPAINLFAQLGEKIITYLGPGFKKLGDVLLGSPDEFTKKQDEFWKKLTEYGEHRGKIQPPEIITPPEKDWIKKWVEQWDALTYSFEQLGIESQESLKNAAGRAVTYMEQIKKAFGEGKATVTDYKNALAAAANAMQKLVAPDITKSMADLQKRYEEGAKGISRDDPEFRKKIEAWADQINEEMKKIVGPSLAELEASVREVQAKVSQIKIEPTVSIASAVESLKALNDEYKEIKGQMESNPIKIKVDTSGVDTARGAISDLADEGGFPIEGNFDFYGTGSTKKPISEKIKEIIAEFGSLSGAIENIESTIQIKEYESQMAAVQKKIDQLNEVWQSWNYLTMYGSADAKLGWHMNEQMRIWMEKMDEYTQDLEILKLRRTEEELRSYEDSYQTGTAYVPKTGLYKLHKGEEVRTTNQVSMAMGGFNFHIYGGDPKAIATQIEKILKYQISGSLIETIKKIR